MKICSNLFTTQFWPKVVAWKFCKITDKVSLGCPLSEKLIISYKQSPLADDFRALGVVSKLVSNLLTGMYAVEIRSSGKSRNLCHKTFLVDSIALFNWDNINSWCFRSSSSFPVDSNSLKKIKRTVRKYCYGVTKFWAVFLICWLITGVQYQKFSLFYQKYIK